jgi:hypothetical protein
MKRWTQLVCILVALFVFQILIEVYNNSQFGWSISPMRIGQAMVQWAILLGGVYYAEKLWNYWRGKKSKR